MVNNVAFKHKRFLGRMRNIETTHILEIILTFENCVLWKLRAKVPNVYQNRKFYILIMYS